MLKNQNLYSKFKNIKSKTAHKSQFVRSIKTNRLGNILTLFSFSKKKHSRDFTVPLNNLISDAEAKNPLLRRDSSNTKFRFIRIEFWMWHTFAVLSSFCTIFHHRTCLALPKGRKCIRRYNHSICPPPFHPFVPHTASWKPYIK